MSRQTVKLSDETTKILELYVKKRGVNNSAAIASMVSDTLDEWVNNQNVLKKHTIGNATNAPIKGVLTDFRSNLFSQELSAIAINIARELNLSQMAEDVSKLFIKTIETVVPGDFEKNQTTYFRNIFAKYLSQSDYFQNWYQNFAMMFPESRATFDSELMIHGYFSFVDDREDNIFDITDEEIVGILINNYWRKLPLKLSNQNLDQIKKFLDQNKDGLIIINGLTGSGKTTLMVELAQRTHAVFNPIEVRSFDRDFEKPNLSKISTMHAEDNESALNRLHEWATIFKAKPENLKKGTPILFIHTKIRKDTKAKTYPRYVSEIKEAVY